VGPTKWAYGKVQGRVWYCFIFCHTPCITIKHVQVSARYGVWSRPFWCMGHYRDSGAEVSATGVDQPHKSVRVCPRDHMGVFHRVCLRPFSTVGTVQSWFGDVASCRRGRGPIALARVRSLRILLAEVCSFAHLAYLLGGGLVVHPALQTCSAWTGSVAPPRILARRGLARSPCLADLLGSLVIRPASHTCSARAWWFAPPCRLAR
jgi:hypothetical protein